MKQSCSPLEKIFYLYRRYRRGEQGLFYRRYHEDGFFSRKSKREKSFKDLVGENIVVRAKDL